MNRELFKKIGLLLFACALVGIPVSGANAQNAALGKTVRFIIGFGPGGGYDTYSRLFARHLGAHLPGHPNVVAQNMPGAASIRAARYLYFKAPKDGSAIGMIGQGVYLAQQLGQSKIDFDVKKFNWVGRLTNNTPVIFTWHKSPITSREDFFKKKVILFGAVSARLDYAFLKKLTGARIKVIRDYKSTSSAALAMQRGEIYGMEMPWPVVLSKHANWVREKKIIPILQAGAEKDPHLPNVPRMIDIAKNDHARKLFEFIAQASGIGRSVVAPPDLSSHVLAMLRKGFSDTVHDPKFLSDAKHARLTLGPLTGKQLAALVRRDGEYPAAIVKEAAGIVKAAGLIH